MRKLGSKQQKAYDFIKRVNGWHEFDRSAKREILSLEKLGLVDVALYDRNNVAGEYKLSFTESLKINPAIQHMQTMEHQIKEEPKRISCPQCVMLSINGHPCHETECPNSGARYDVESGEWIKQYICRECGFTVDADDPCCSALNETMHDQND